MPVPINLPGVPLASGAQALPAVMTSWLRQVQQAINALGAQRAYAAYTPVTGFSQLIPVNTGLCLLTPAGALATGTVTLPATAADGFEQQILSTQTVATLTVAPSSGQTIVGTASLTLTAGVQIVYRYSASAKTWYRMQ